ISTLGSPSRRTRMSVAASLGRKVPGTSFSSSVITIASAPALLLEGGRTLLWRGVRPLRELEAQAAGQGCGFDELHADDVAELVHRAGAVPDHGVALLVVAKVFEA